MQVKRRIYTKIDFVFLLLITINTLNPDRAVAQLGIPVFDTYNNGVGAVAKFIATASEVIQRDIMPWKERISKVQAFFKKANEKISVVVKNMAMTRRLIEMEVSIRELFLSSRQQVQGADNLAEKWKHIWILTNLWYESLRVFETFDLVYKEGDSIMDDEGRIRIIRDALKKARKIRRSMIVAIQRVNKEIARTKRQRKEVAFYKKIFLPT